MREIYWPHRHNGRRDAQDITVIPYFRAMRARRGVARRSVTPRFTARTRRFRSRILIRAITRTGRDKPDRISPEPEAPSSALCPQLRFEYPHRVAHLSQAASTCNFAESDFNVTCITITRISMNRVNANLNLINLCRGKYLCLSKKI